MAIEEMELLDMTFDKKYLKEVLCQLKETKYFYPQPATKIVNNVKDVFTMTPDEDYKNMLDELKELAEHVKLDTSSVKEGSIHFAKEDYRKALDDVTKEAKKSNTFIIMYLFIGRTKEYMSLPRFTILSISGACLARISYSLGPT